ncbi:uncharacterized protein EI90DRAFT_250151 [Cantharellus anzutake]|uniref:uncharacterized protein n=1 Tax=Cantharellus anzutake TaxID=1750568 RepID=UPI00190534DE|nr:uncharacterized protein EI90DRAFT_250151 [Cantharellus anzutake]KAF8335726.1 hypothetical protein EI90DRAFT_250151 [Cantharellus anzutake]
MSLQTLILDVLIEILSYIGVRDILSLQRTCKGIRRVTQLHTVWKNVLEKHIIPSGQSISLPSNVPLPDQSALDLKRAAIYAARLEHNWTSVTPRIFTRTQFCTASRVNRTFFIPGHSGKYLLTVSGGDEVSIWYLEPDLGRSWKILDWNVQGTVIDAVPNSDGWARATMALSHTSDRSISFSSRHLCITLYNLAFCDDGGGRPTATCEQIFEGKLPGRLENLRGNLIGMYRRFRLGGYLFNYQSQVTIELQGAAAQPVS